MALSLVLDVQGLVDVGQVVDRPVEPYLIECTAAREDWPQDQPFLIGEVGFSWVVGAASTLLVGTLAAMAE